MAIVIADLGEIVAIVQNILNVVNLIRGQTSDTAREDHPKQIEQLCFDIRSYCQDILTAANNTKTDVDAMRTVTGLTLQDVINAMPGSAPVVLPTPPPTGYSTLSANDVWSYLLANHPWPVIGTVEYSGDLLIQAGTSAVGLSQGGAFVAPDCPDFALVGDTADQVAVVVQGIQEGWTEPTGIDWSSWNGTENIVAFLNRVASGIAWSYTNLYGVVTPGWAWGVPHTGVSYVCWFCRVSDADLATKAGATPGGLTKAQNYSALSLAVGLASLFALGAGDVSALVSEITTLLADSADLSTALGSLITWLSGRSETTIQAQETALTTLTGDVTTLTNSGTHTLQTILDAIAALTAPDNADIATIKADVVALQSDVTYIKDHLPAAAKPVAPSWPGLSGVTLGSSVPLTDELVVTGPLSGVLVHLTSGPAGASRWLIGGEYMYYSWGEVAFQTDDGYLEPFQWLGANDAIYMPRQIQSAAAVLFHVRRDASGTVTPFTVN
jgi:hypothetical protein